MKYEKKIKSLYEINTAHTHRLPNDTKTDNFWTRKKEEKKSKPLKRKGKLCAHITSLSKVDNDLISPLFLFNLSTAWLQQIHPVKRGECCVCRQFPALSLFDQKLKTVATPFYQSDQAEQTLDMQPLTHPQTTDGWLHTLSANEANSLTIEMEPRFRTSCAIAWMSKGQPNSPKLLYLDFKCERAKKKNTNKHDADDEEFSTIHQEIDPLQTQVS